jgi:uncharacterized protein Yka (UPF0111/DUF47 family)
MGLFWDLIQQSPITRLSSQTDSLERRVSKLEHQMDAMNRLLREMLTRPERRLGEDVDHDGRIG